MSSGIYNQAVNEGACVFKHRRYTCIRHTSDNFMGDRTIVLEEQHTGLNISIVVNNFSYNAAYADLAIENGLRNAEDQIIQEEQRLLSRVSYSGYYFSSPIFLSISPPVVKKKDLSFIDKLAGLEI